METRMKLKRLIAWLACVILLAGTAYAAGSPGEPPGKNTVKALLLLDDLYGSSLNIEDNQNNILENFTEYGWDISIACCTPEVKPCPLAVMQGCKVIHPDLRTYELDNALEWDVIIVVPGGDYSHLISCPFVHSLLTRAKEQGIPIAAWCRGVRVLAHAGIIEDVQVTGDADFEDEYLAAGAVYLGEDHPPVFSQGIISCAQDKLYRQQMCKLICEAVENSASARSGKSARDPEVELDIYPNPVRSSTTLEFTILEGEMVHILIYDQSGNMVLEVVRQEFEAGLNKVTFDPTELPTGMYYLYLVTRNAVGMRKCMII